MPRYHKQRRGTTTIEFALVTPAVLFMLLATIIAGIGIFRYHQVAALAREGSRWASVHGAMYEEETGNSAATADDVFQKAILPMAMAMQEENLSYEVTWDQSNEPLQVADDVSSPFGNKVSVTVHYRWFPELYITGPFDLSSTSTAQMAY